MCTSSNGISLGEGDVESTWSEGQGAVSVGQSYAFIIVQVLRRVHVKSSGVPSIRVMAGILRM